MLASCPVTFPFRVFGRRRDLSPMPIDCSYLGRNQLREFLNRLALVHIVAQLDCPGRAGSILAVA